MKKMSKTVSTSRKKNYFLVSTLNTVLFGQVPPKPNQKHHLYHISLLTDRFGSTFLKSGSGLTKKPGSIMIRMIRNSDLFASALFRVAVLVILLDPDLGWIRTNTGMT